MATSSTSASMGSPLGNSTDPNGYTNSIVYDLIMAGIHPNKIFVNPDGSVAVSAYEKEWDKISFRANVTDSAPYSFSNVALSALDNEDFNYKAVQNAGSITEGVLNKTYSDTWVAGLNTAIVNNMMDLFTVRAPALASVDGPLAAVGINTANLKKQVTATISKQFPPIFNH